MSRLASDPLVTVATDAFAGWTYGPWSPARRQIECCTFVQRVLEEFYGQAGWPIPRPPDWRTRMNIIGDVSPWSPVEMVAELLDRQPSIPPESPLLTPGRWHICQGWRRLPGSDRPSGHTWLWLASDADMGWRLESSSRGGIGPSVNGHRLGAGVDPEPIPWSEVARRYSAGVAVALAGAPA